MIDESWDLEARDDVASYFRRGLLAKAYMGRSPCRLCDRTNNGSLELTDGVYIWPEGLAHYVLDHSVRLPQEFLDYIDEAQGKFLGSEVDESWWREATSR